jgi:DNA polymerase III epsilon subunit family exonuclease
MEMIRNSYQILDNPDLEFVAFDIETTGLSPTADRIIELGAVKFSTGGTIEFFEELINPEREIPQDAIEVHGITPEMLVGKPTLAEVLPRFFKFSENTILVAHNAEFDVSFILRGMGFYGLGRDLPHRVVDTLPMSKLAFPNRQTYKLQDLAKDLGINTVSAHRAKDDALVCSQLFLKCLRTLNPGGQASFF